MSRCRTCGRKNAIKNFDTGGNIMAEYTKAQLTELIIGKLHRNFGRDVERRIP